MDGDADVELVDGDGYGGAITAAGDKAAGLSARNLGSALHIGSLGQGSPLTVAAEVAYQAPTWEANARDLIENGSPNSDLFF